MTRLLEEAFEAVSRLPEAEQDAIAARMLSDLRAEEQWDAKFTGTEGGLASLASRALAEHNAGRTRPFDKDSDLSPD